MGFLSQVELLQIQKVLIQSPYLQTADAAIRRAFLTNCNLSEICGAVFLIAPTNQEFVETFWPHLLDHCVVLDGITRLRLSVVLEHLGQIDMQLPEDSKRFIEQIVIRGKQREELFALTSEAALPTENLVRIYSASLPTMIAPHPGIPLWNILEHLWDIPGGLSLFRFVEQLARVADTHTPHVATELRMWMERTASLLGIQQNDIDRMHADLAQGHTVAGDGDAYLLVELDTDVNDPELYRVCVLLWKHQNDAQYWSIDEEPHSLKDIPQLLEDVLMSNAGDLLQIQGELIIEFFLPYQLLSHAVDQWLTQDQIPYGIEHPVVVRSLERVKYPKVYFRTIHHWKQKWAWFKSNVAHTTCIPHWLCDQDIRDLKKLHVLLTKDTETCLGLTFSPAEASGVNDILPSILKAGIPVMVWLRSGSGSVKPDNIRTELDNILSSTCLLELYNVVKDVRFQAYGNKAHIGNALTLLWDDPDRIPPKFIVPLTAP